MTVGQYFRSLKLIFYSLFLGFGIFYAAILLLEIDLVSVVISEIRGIQLFLAFMIFLQIVASRFLVRSILSRVMPDMSFSEKLKRWRVANIVRWANLEAALIMAVLLHLLTADYMLLGLVAIVGLIYMLNYPSKAMAVKDLRLDHPEIELLANEQTALHFR